MLDPTAKLSVSRQASVLGISRSSVYYKPRPVSEVDLKLMHRIDKLHMEFPFAGSRMLVSALPPPIMRRVDYSTKFHGMSSSMFRCMCWLRILRSVAAV